MEVVSSAASGIAIVSIAIQLIDSISKLADFLGSIQEAPENLKIILEDLNILSMILNGIQLQQNQYGSNASIMIVLKSLEDKVTPFLTLVKRYEPGFLSSSRRIRKWTAIKAVFKDKKFKHFQQSLIGTKTTLILAMLPSRLSNQHQNLMMINQEVENLHVEQSISTSHTQHHGLILEEVTDPQPDSGHIAVCYDNQRFSQDNEAELAVSKPSPIPRHRCSRTTTLSATRTVFGTIWLKSIKYNCETCSRNDLFIPNSIAFRDENNFTLHPARWLTWLGIKTGLDGTFSRSIQGWKNTLRPFSAVPDDALIFAFCKDGNIDGVRTLLLRGEASVWDRDSLGETPLHKAVLYGKTELCKFLVDRGADKTATDYHLSPACYNYGLDPDSLLDMLRLFTDCSDFYEPYETQFGRSMWLTFFLATYAERDGNYTSIDSVEGRRVYPKADTAAVWWTKLYLSDISDNLTSDIVVAVWRWSKSALFLEWFVNITRSTNLTICEETGWSPVMSVLKRFNFFWGYPDESKLSKIRLLIKMGASPHFTYCEQKFGVFHEMTPTACLILNPTCFKEWRNILRENNIDIENLVEQELNNGPFERQGWNKETLLKMFLVHIDDRPNNEWDHRYQCNSCNGRKYRFMNYGFRESWMKYLEAVKKGLDLNELGDYHAKSSGEETGLCKDCVGKYYDVWILDIEPIKNNSSEEYPSEDIQQALSVTIPGSFEPITL